MIDAIDTHPANIDINVSETKSKNTSTIAINAIFRHSKFHVQKFKGKFFSKFPKFHRHSNCKNSSITHLKIWKKRWNSQNAFNLHLHQNRRHSPKSKARTNLKHHFADHLTRTCSCLQLIFVQCLCLKYTSRKWKKKFTNRKTRYRYLLWSCSPSDKFFVFAVFFHSYCCEPLWQTFFEKTPLTFTARWYLGAPYALWLIGKTRHTSN